MQNKTMKQVLEELDEKPTKIFEVEDQFNLETTTLYYDLGYLSLDIWEDKIDKSINYALEVKSSNIYITKSYFNSLDEFREIASNLTEIIRKYRKFIARV